VHRIGRQLQHLRPDRLERVEDAEERRALGAIGALGYLSPVLRPRLAGLERADSLAFDLHKWAQVPYDAGCLLVRDGALHAATFQVEAGYLGSLPGGVVPHDSHAFHRFTPGLSRGDRALKIWMTFQAYGLERITRVFEANVEQAHYLATRIAHDPSFVLLGPVALNIVCFRYRARQSSPEASDALHERALLALQTSGFAVLSPCRHEGRSCFRVALSNHRTRHADLDALLERLARLEQDAR
jgi:aromatic-L-amino-acid/L-tryptophan decarboxylase